MAEAKIKIAIVILNWNGKEDTLDCLKSVNRLAVYGFELSIIVVDNGSTDGSYGELNKISNIQFKLIRNSDNLGFAAGNNVGIKAALQEKADYLLILNNDTLVDKNLVVQLFKASQKNKDAAILSPKIYFVPGFEFHKDEYPKYLAGKIIWYAGGKIDWNNVYGQNLGVDEVDRGQYDQTREIDFATGACLFLKSKILEEVGLFDEKYYMYFEDADLSLRVKKCGYKVFYVPSAYLWHKVAQSSAIGSNLNDYFLTRNRLLFGLRNAPLRTKLALLKESLRFLVNGRKWQKIAVKDFYLGRFKKGSWK